MGRGKTLGAGEAGKDGRAACVCCGRRAKVKRGTLGYGIIRGVCLACRGSMRRLVARGETTWEELEQSGVLLPVELTGNRQRRILERVASGRAAGPVPAGPARDGRAKEAVLSLLGMMRRHTRKEDERAAIDRLVEAVNGVK